MVNVLAMPVHVGAKTGAKRFAGATFTYCLEGMMRDGKALQMRHLARARPELRPRLRDHVLDEQRRPTAGVDHVVGHVARAWSAG